MKAASVIQYWTRVISRSFQTAKEWMGLREIIIDIVIAAIASFIITTPRNTETLLIFMSVTLVVAVVLFLLVILIFALFVIPYQDYKSLIALKKAQSESEDTNLEQDAQKRQILVNNLKELKSEYTTVRILIAKIEHRPLADTLKAIFDLAGWHTKGIPYPLDKSQFDKYITGIEVQGFNYHLVQSIAEAFTRAGLYNVKTNVLDLKPKPSNPDYFKITSQLITITIGDRKK